MFYEIIYETGAHSVAQYDSDEEAMSAITAHNERAVNGEIGGPSGHNAERIKRVYVYDRHPVTEGESQAVTIDQIHAAIDAAVDMVAVGDMVSVPEIAAAVRDITSPTVNSGPHESNFAADSVRELSLPWAA